MAATGVVVDVVSGGVTAVGKDYNDFDCSNNC